MSIEDNSEYIFIWRIKNYSSCYQEKGAYIDSPFFSVENLVGCQWNLSFSPKGSSELEKNDFVSYYLEWHQTDEKVTETPPIDYSLDIVDMVGNKLKSRRLKIVFSEESPAWGEPRFMRIDELTTEMDSWEEDVLTLQCRIKCGKFKKQGIFKTEACTLLDVERRLFEWDITAPLLLEHSETVFFPINDLFKFEITLTSLLDGLQFLIHLKEHQSDLSQPVIFKITLWDKKGCKITSKRAGHLFKDAETWKFPDFVTKDILETCKLDSIKAEFKLMFEIYVSKKRISFNGIQKLYLESSFTCPCAIAIPKVCPISAMQNDFRSLFINKKYFDVTIRVQEEEFPAHKLVLRVRSPVFEAMFDQNLLENETGIVNVTDIDGKTMKTFLEFLYTETVDIMEYESAKKLLFAADKYQVSSLVNECVSYLISVLSVENACEIITIADSVYCERLKSYALDFIVSNAAKILINPNWRPWIKENVELATDIFTKLSTNLITKYK